MLELATVIRDALSYDPSTGLFTWRVSPCKNVKAGDAAGFSRAGGYVGIQIGGKTYYAHRLAWLYVHGRWPTHQLDHINRIRGDNRIANLRECTNTENQQNRNVSRANVSGFTGVSWNRAARKWVAQIRAHGRKQYLGLFPTSEAAHAAYTEAKRKFHSLCPEGIA